MAPLRTSRLAVPAVSTLICVCTVVALFSVTVPENVVLPLTSSSEPVAAVGKSAAAVVLNCRLLAIVPRAPWVWSAVPSSTMAVWVGEALPRPALFWMLRITPDLMLVVVVAPP